MKERWRRLTAIVKADLLIRFRRPSTAVVFLLLSAVPYLWIPDPATGRALLVIESKRALYNSAAIGMATAILATTFVGLAGFYVISNAIRRDVLSRCGFVIASTTMRGSEYLVGKVLGNIAFLTTFVAGFMATSMLMLVLRGEAPLEPLVFARQYLLLVPPTIIFVSVVAILFESIPFLSGKVGDVLYFLLWAGSLGAVAANVSGTTPGFAGFFDVSGFGLLKAGLAFDRVSIGASGFDASKGIHVFSGFALAPSWIAARAVATVLPLFVIPVALLFFHRFDPARVKQAIQKTNRSWMARLGMLAKPLAGIVYSAGARGGGRSLLSSARADAFMALTAFPLSVLLIGGFMLVSMIAPAGTLIGGFLPFAFAAAAILIADVAPREQRAGTLGFLYSAPRLKQQFVWWKLLTAMIICGVILIGPLLRVAISRPAALPALITGILFVSAFATALGVISSNPKTFIITFLTFWYVVISDHGANRSLDFAGFYAPATPAVIATYATASAAILALAQFVHAARLRRAF